MEMIDLLIPSTNKFATDYLENRLNHQLFFDYALNEPNTFHNRKNELLNREFPREKLVQHLLHYNRKYQCSLGTIKNIEKLLDPTSVVVIGGQQAGLLTGPLYTIHKVVSIIKFAKLKEQELATPVVPVFWIAGEDHDFAEINHVYIKENGAIKKKGYPEQHKDKKMVADLPVCKSLCWNWIKEIFSTFEETNYTNDLLYTIKNCLDMSTSYVDFFAALILKLFAKEGIVVINSAEAELRDIEADFFQKLIEKNEEVYEAVRAQQEVIQEHQYSKVIEMIKGSVNLFYHVNNERVLLQKNETGNSYCGKNGECDVTMEDMLYAAKYNPRLLSNNVVTRPLMQEFLFPTIAFISGPGEIAYWAELKQAFSLFGMKMPPVVPRLNITFLERNIETDLHDLNLELLDVLKYGVEEKKLQWIERNTGFDYEEAIQKAKNEMEKIHSDIRKKAYEIDANLKFLLEKNAQMIFDQFDFMKESIKKANLRKHDDQIKKFNRIDLSLRPNGSPQERIWNIFYYLNKYGEDFIERIVNLDYDYNGKHKVIRI